MASYPHAPLELREAPHSHMESSQYPPPPGLPARYTGARTPSPTPSEVEATSSLLDIKRYASWKFWARKEWIPWYIIGTIFLVIAILISVFDKQIVHFLTPAGKWMRGLPFGWLIPIAILFVISFPPLFGHEIVAILVGVIWGLGVGFAIVAAGTFLGEIGNFYAFKYCCRSRGEKMEKNSIVYGCLARVVREGGFKVALIIRLSVIPGHFSTAVFSTCGMGIIVFALAAFFSLPKQLITVYLGVILEEAGSGGETARDKIISRSVLGATILITVAAAVWIWREINRVKPVVIYERRKARQVKMAISAYDMENTSTTALNPPEAERPLNVIPQRPAQFPLRQDVGNYAGYGGYAPSYTVGRYGELLEDDDQKNSQVGWETRGARVADMRRGPWGASSKPGHLSDDDDGSEESMSTLRPPAAQVQPSIPPPPGFKQESPQLRPQPSPAVHVQSENLPLPGPAVHARSENPPLPNPHAEDAQHPRRRFQLSDPPVGTHTPFASDSTYGYSSTREPSSERSLLAYEAGPPEVAPRVPMGGTSPNNAPRGHAAEATDASFYTAMGSPPRSPTETPMLPPVRSMSPMNLRK